jgi:hypothetical protein
MAGLEVPDADGVGRNLSLTRGRDIAKRFAGRGSVDGRLREFPHATVLSIEK